MLSLHLIPTFLAVSIANSLNANPIAVTRLPSVQRGLRCKLFLGIKAYSSITSSNNPQQNFLSSKIPAFASSIGELEILAIIMFPSFLNCLRNAMFLSSFNASLKS